MPIRPFRPFQERSLETIAFVRRSPNLKNRLVYLALFSETAMVRLWMAWSCIGWVFVMLNGTLTDHAALQLMYSLAPPWVWGLGFGVNAAALFYGAVTKRVHKWSICLEPILGLILWTTTALSHAQVQHSIGPVTLGAVIYFWLLIRFPTLQERKRERNLKNGV